MNHNTSAAVELDTDEVEDLADTLSFVEGWLRRADHEALADLADYIDPNTAPGNVRDVADVFIIRLGLHTMTLRQRLKQAGR